MDNTQISKEKITAAIEAFKSGTPSEIVDAVGALTDAEKTVVKLVQELTAPPQKKKRSDAGTKRAKATA